MSESQINNPYKAIYPKDLPYINLEYLEGRRIPLHTFHDGNQWHCWFPLDSGLLQPLRVVDFAEGIYLAANPVREDDIYFDFLNFIYKHVELREISKFLSALTSDILNIGASLKKLDILSKVEDYDGKSRLALTELEYLLVVCKSMFDLLQEILSRIWKMIQLTDTNKQKKNLPQTFAKMILADKNIRSYQNIYENFGLPLSLANWYAKSAPFFLSLRDARDAIIHQPTSEPLIYDTDKGFAIAVSSSSKVFNNIIEWPRSVLENKSIGSLNYFVAYVINETLGTIEAFFPAFQKEIQFLPDYVPDYKFFVRSPTTKSLLGVQRILATDHWGDFS